MVATMYNWRGYRHGENDSGEMVFGEIKDGVGERMVEVQLEGESMEETRELMKRKREKMMLLDL